MPYPKLNRDLLAIKKLSDRKNKVYIEKGHIPFTQKPANLSELGEKLIRKTADRIRLACQGKRSVMLTFGAHTIKNGMSPTLIVLMEEGWVTHFSTNGAGIIHDWEFAFQGKLSEDVRENVELWQFGIWDHTGFNINLALKDFLSFANSVYNLENGVYMSIGSAVMLPMIFEKALSLSQNLMIQENKHIDNHFMLIVDLAKSDWDWQKNGEPPMDNPAYYLCYCKTFNRMGGEMHYLTADNRDFLLALHQELTVK